MILLGNTNYKLSKNDFENLINMLSTHFGYMTLALQYEHYDSLYAYLNSIVRTKILCENFIKDPDYESYLHKIEVISELANYNFNRNLIENKIRDGCINNNLRFDNIKNNITIQDIYGWMKHEFEKMEHKYFAYKHGHYDKILAYLNSIDRLELMYNKISQNTENVEYKNKIEDLKKTANKIFNREEIENKIKKGFLVTNNTDNNIITGGSKTKYLKYKNKYLELKNK
jgi:hypothetical protein